MTTAASTTSLVERILAEGPLGISEAATKLGSFRGGHKTHPSTLTRWANKGVRLADGSTLRLETIRLNNRLATSYAAIVRFLEAQQEPAQPATVQRTPADRRKASEAAERELATAGR